MSVYYFARLAKEEEGGAVRVTEQKIAYVNPIRAVTTSGDDGLWQDVDVRGLTTRSAALPPRKSGNTR
jgi:hypothetical protein